MRTALLLIATCSVLMAEIVPSARRITWQGTSGVDGGIPTNRTQYGATLSAPSSAATIQAALNAAASEATESVGRYVLLGAGSFTIDTMLDIPRYVTLRGSGAAVTTITGNLQTLVRMYEYQAWDDMKSISGSLAKGDTSMTLTASYAGIGVGMVVQVIESNDSRIVAGIEADIVPSPGGGQLYAMGQWVRLTNVSGATLTFEPPLTTPYAAANSPKIYFPFLGAGGTSRNFCKLAGLENVQLVNTYNSSSSQRTVVMGFADQCWMKNVHAVNAYGGHVGTFDTYRCEIRHCTFDGVLYAAGSPSGPLTSSAGYGIQIGSPNGGGPSSKTSGMLIEDNILIGCRGAILLGYGATGCVIGYNYITHVVSEYVYPDSDLRQKPAIMIHSSFCTNNLIEGNISTGKGFHADLYHGNSYWTTVARNWFKGKDAGKESALHGIEVDGFSRYSNLVGNVLGYSGIVSEVAAFTSPSGSSNRRIDASVSRSYDHQFNAIMLGYKGEGASDVTWDDPQVAATTLDHGNFDYVSNSQRWETNNTNVSDYADHSIPYSYYITSKPDWFYSLTWPAIDPASPPSSDAVIPAGYRYIYGVDPTGSSNGITIGTLNVGTLNL